MIKILLVDDDPYMSQFLSHFLEGAGYETLQACDGIEAVEQLEKNNVDLVISDIAMPRMNGYQLYDHISSMRPMNAPPFFFISARSMDSDIQYAEQLGIKHYFTKPIKLPKLLGAIQATVESVGDEPNVRGNQDRKASTQLSIGLLLIDPTKFAAYLGAQPLDLSTREFQLLYRLAQDVNRVVPTEELVRVTHSQTASRKPAASVRSIVRSLRRKLSYTVGDPGCIHNVRGVGYLLRPTSDDLRDSDNHG